MSKNIRGFSNSANLTVNNLAFKDLSCDTLTSGDATFTGTVTYSGNTSFGGTVQVNKLKIIVLDEDDADSNPRSVPYIASDNEVNKDDEFTFTPDTTKMLTVKNLTVPNPGEIYYKGQTLDTRFSSGAGFVDLSTDQTIAGVKTFTDVVKCALNTPDTGNNFRVVFQNPSTTALCKNAGFHFSPSTEKLTVKNLSVGSDGINTTGAISTTALTVGGNITVNDNSGSAIVTINNNSGYIDCVAVSATGFVTTGTGLNGVSLDASGNIITKGTFEVLDGTTQVALIDNSGNINVKEATVTALKQHDASAGTTTVIQLGDIATNKSAISTNTSDISTNTTAINNKVGKTGDENIAGVKTFDDNLKVGSLFEVIETTGKVKCKLQTASFANDMAIVFHNGTTLCECDGGNLHYDPSTDTLTTFNLKTTGKVECLLHDENESNDLPIVLQNTSDQLCKCDESKLHYNPNTNTLTTEKLKTTGLITCELNGAGNADDMPIVFQNTNGQLCEDANNKLFYHPGDNILTTEYLTLTALDNTADASCQIPLRQTSTGKLKTDSSFAYNASSDTLSGVNANFTGNLLSKGNAVVDVDTNQDIDGVKDFIGTLKYNGTDLNSKYLSQVPNDYVKLDATNQTILGEKDFTGTLKSDGKEVMTKSGDNSVTGTYTYSSTGKIRSNLPIEYCATPVLLPSFMPINAVYRIVAQSFLVDTTVTDPTGNLWGQGTNLCILNNSGVTATSYGTNFDWIQWTAGVNTGNSRVATTFTVKGIPGLYRIRITQPFTTSSTASDSRVNAIIKLNKGGTLQNNRGWQSTYARQNRAMKTTVTYEDVNYFDYNDTFTFETYANSGTNTGFTDSLSTYYGPTERMNMWVTYLGPLTEYDRTPS